MTNLFDVEGPDLDMGFVNIKGAQSRTEQEQKVMLQSMWERYEPYADPDFRQGFARDMEARFWELYLAIMLMDAGRKLLPRLERPRTGGQPDICVLDNGRRIWIEAIAPTEGEPGPDQLVRPVPINEGGEFVAMPVRQAQLRVTSAFFKKAGVLQRYLERGVMADVDVRIIAISASRFGPYVSEWPLPLVMTSLFPLGDEFVTVDRETGQATNSGFHYSPTIHRAGSPIPRSAFLNDRFSHVSGVVWSRLGLGNLSRQVRPITYVHNPLALVPLATHWAPWDREFLTTLQGDEWECRDLAADS